MKKNNKEQDSPNLTRTELDLAIIMNRIENRLGALENKLDNFINRPAERRGEEKSFSKPFQYGGRSHQYNKERGRDNFRERNFFKTICADCNKECEVPFKPTGDRPVYCKECFAKRKQGDLFERDRDKAGDKRTFAKKSHFNKRHGGENKKEFPKKRKKGKRSF